VEVGQLYSIDDPYKLRYPRVTTLWSLTSLPLRPSDYFRPSDGLTYKDLFGDASLSNLGICLFFRYKISIFDFGVGVGYGQGLLNSPTYSGSSLGVDITSYKLRAWINTLTDEPYLVPFVGVEYLNIIASESDGSTTLVTQLPGALMYRVGLQVQLNFIDEMASRQAFQSVGLENTFLEASYFSLLNKTEELFLTPLSGISIGLALEF
jgi:hypothetical protein